RIDDNLKAELWVKCEQRNPGGSVKDRPALAMIRAAEESGALRPGATLIEATSGHMGSSMAMIAAERGYRCLLVMPEDMSMERRYLLKAYGAEIELTPAEQAMSGAVARAREIMSKTRGACMLSQFENAANPLAHELGTGPELIEQMQGTIDAFVVGVGTGGTLTGVGRALRRKFGQHVKLVAVEPAASAVLSGQCAGLHGIQGLGAGFVPKILDRSLIDSVVTVSDVAAQRMCRTLAEKEGLLVGPSSGANVHAAVQVAKGMTGGKVATVLCDSGERYLF
ncbi:MAG TPA: cysteine synthase A, partial [Polyangiaceae bacterium]|nr:cysteine synthase A [Polyangiaceae bacterium]